VRLSLWEAGDRVTAKNAMVYVVGSGPAGVSVAYALLKQGAEVTMLYAGLEK
jgi:NADPH-dependent glutamate synthase beta subunit-like oxidoreductase